ncbi:hypothetical protein QTP88_026659 [Uroleucon formosanum]
MDYLTHYLSWSWNQLCSQYISSFLMFGTEQYLLCPTQNRRDVLSENLKNQIMTTNLWVEQVMFVFT